MKKVLFLAGLFLAITVYASAQDKDVKQRTISVTGTAEMEITPDEIYVQVDLKEYDKKGVGKIDIETIKSNFLNACKSIGINDADITVHSFGGTGTDYWQVKKRKKDPDMKAAISYWIKLSTTKKMDELVDKLDDEATTNFFIAKTDYSKKEELKKQLKIEAIKAAKNKAVYLTDAIQEHVGEALTIEDIENAGTRYDNTILSQFSAGNSVLVDNMYKMPEVSFNQMKFQFQVSVVFLLN